MRYMAIVPLVVLLKFAPPLPGQTTGTARHGSGEGKNASTTNKTSPTKTMTAFPFKQTQAPNVGGDNIASNNPEYNVKLTGLPSVSVADKQLTFLDYVFNWGPWVFTLGLVLVGVFQVGLMMRQAALMQRQAEIMDKQRKESGTSSNTAAETANNTLAAIREQADAMKSQLSENADRDRACRGSISSTQTPN